MRCWRMWWRVGYCSTGHWVPVQSPRYHERVGVLGLEFGYRLSLERILPIVRFPSLICLDRWIKLKLSYVALASSDSSVVQPVSARRRHRPATTTDTTSTDGTGASGAPPAKRNTRGLCRQLKTAKVTRVTNSRISIGYDKRHRAAPTAELHISLAHDIGHVVQTHCPMQWKSLKVMPDEIKMEVRGQLSTNYHLEDLNEELMVCVNRLFGERYKQWKSELHHHFEAFDDPQVALQEGCPKELEEREDSWAWLCAHFQAPDYVEEEDSSPPFQLQARDNRRNSFVPFLNSHIGWMHGVG
ncbi:unnamed protein product [Prunus armeniaca]